LFKKNKSKEIVCQESKETELGIGSIEQEFIGNCLFFEVDTSMCICFHWLPALLPSHGLRILAS